VKLAAITGRLRRAAHELAGTPVTEAPPAKAVSPRPKAPDPAKLAYDFAVAALGATRPLTFVQVGANDGVTGDPVRDLVLRYGERAILIEPQPGLMDALRSAYATFTGKLEVLPIAIGASQGTLMLYRLAPSAEDAYQKAVGRPSSALASFDRDALHRKIAKRLQMSGERASSVIEQLPCPMLPLSDVLQKHNVEHIDVLQVDCEGYDVEVIKSLGVARPTIINFEHHLLTAEAWAEWETWAREGGYGYVRGKADCLAVRGATPGSYASSTV
jgi:FkbM family methyltransferase